MYVPKQAMASLSDEAAQTALQSAATRQPEEVHAVMERGNVSQLQDTDAQPPELHEVPLATYPKRAHPLFAPSPASAMPPSPLQAALAASRSVRHVPDLKSVQDLPLAHVPSAAVASRHAALCDPKMERHADVQGATPSAAPKVHSNRIRHEAWQPACSAADGPSGSESPQLAGKETARARPHMAKNERVASRRRVQV